MSRALEEWVGKTDDTAIPPRVKVRVFAKHHGHCPICTLKIVGKLTPAFDHIAALINGGENRESNIQLLCSECHKTKTRSDVREKSQFYQKTAKRLNVRKKRTIPGRKFDGTPIPSRWK
jgi:hypothetical protein